MEGNARLPEFSRPILEWNMILRYLKFNRAVSHLGGKSIGVSVAREPRDAGGFNTYGIVGQ